MSALSFLFRLDIVEAVIGFRHKFGSVGTPVENTEIKIIDERDPELPLGK